MNNEYSLKDTIVEVVLSEPQFLIVEQENLALLREFFFVPRDNTHVK